MKDNGKLRSAAELMTTHYRHSKWLKAVTAMAAVVVFCTVYALMLPVVALDSQTYCGIEEHTHGENCYEQQLVCGQEEGETAGHVHTDECYETETVLVCGEEESEAHTHTEDCYDADGNLICGMEESEGHTHSDACYEEQQTLICGMEEGEGATSHTHSDECYESVLTCEQEEHTHSEACMTEPADESAADTSAEAEETLYDRLMATETAADMLAMLEAEEEQPTFTGEELTALTEKAEAFEEDEDGSRAALLDTLNYLATGEYGTEEADTGDENANYWKSTVPVYWDITNGTSGEATSSNYGTYVTSVKINTNAVVWGDSDATSWSGGSTLATYFGNISKGESNMVDKSMSITAAQGYYVTKIIVACAPYAGSETHSPYNCTTWKSGNNLVSTYNLSQSTYDSSTGRYTLTFDVNSIHFSHNGRDTPSAYFILIQVAKVPTPLFVEYNYGDISKYVNVKSSSSNFYDPSKWTDADSGNSYGNGSSYTSGVMTDDTQFDYQYPTTNTTVIASWKHYANTISDAALNEAAAAGYYFTGWKVTWYNTCTVSTSKDSYNNNYTFSFSDTYMTSSTLLQPGAEVQLPTNVQLVAQWAPIELTVEKNVFIDGVDTDLSGTDYDFTMQVEKVGSESNTSYEDAFSLKDGESNTLSAVPSGTYTVNETSYPDSITVDNKTYNFSKSDSTRVTLSASNYSGAITVTNYYTSFTPQDVTITKVDSSNTSNTLTGAAFTLYDSTNQKYYQTKGTWSTTSVPLTVGSDGKLTFDDLEAGTYILTETKAPDGYNMLTDTITITVSSDGTVTAKYTSSGASLGAAKNRTSSVWEFNVTNSKGVVLPNTGGPGTTLYTLSGLTLLCGALVYGCVLRRRRERRAD